MQLPEFIYVKGQVQPPATFEITDPEQIAHFPWCGNAYSDLKLFDLVNTYVHNVTITNDNKKQALYNMGFHGMGITIDVTDEELQDYINMTK